MFPVASSQSCTGSPTSSHRAQRPGGECPRSFDVEVAALRCGDTATIEAVFDGLSPRSRAERFLTGMPTLPPSMLRVLASPDGQHHVAMVASTSGQPIGVVRYVRTEPRSAEVAGAVVDAWAGLGVGRTLFTLLSHHAVRQAIHSFVFTVAGGNQRMVQALRRRGAELPRASGVMDGRLDLRLLYGSGDCHGASDLGMRSASTSARNRSPSEAYAQPAASSIVRVYLGEL